MPDSRPKIVVVDDYPGMTKALEGLLNAAGFCTAVFSSAEALLEAGEAAGAACLVLDVHLPGMSGLELRRQLQFLGAAAPPVIFITAYEDPIWQERAQEAGTVASFIKKPFTGKTLLTAIDQAISAGR